MSKIGSTLTYILRHKVDKYRLEIIKDGFVKIKNNYEL
jgi:RNA:NAD 2'-phosphotransferase (TPT1/KptA family)